MDKETLDKARSERDEAYKVYSELKELYLEAEANWLMKKKVFEKYDYELALIDGRLKKLPAKHKEEKPIVLTLDQIERIASALGVSIEKEEIEL